MNLKDIITGIIVPIICAVIGIWAGKTIEKSNIKNNIAQTGIINNANYSLMSEEPLTALINAYIELSKENTDLIQELASLKAENSQKKGNEGSYGLSKSTDSNSTSRLSDDLDINNDDWMDQCQPFLLNGSAGKDLRKIYLNEGKSFTAGGKTFSKGFTLYSYGNNFASFNLEEKYSSVEFYVGHVSGNIYGNILEMLIYVDGKYYDTFSIDMTDAARKIEIPLNYAPSMKIAIKGQCGVVGFGGGHFFE